MTTETPRPRDSQSPTGANNNAALRGASLAFGKPPVKPKPNIDNTYTGNNGALAAATKASGLSRPTSRNTSMTRREAEEQRLRYQRTGGSNVSGYAGDLDRIQQRLSQLDHSGHGFLQPPSPGPDKTRSPSSIAATLAASRSASITPNHTGNQLSPAVLKRHGSFTRRSLARSPGSARSFGSRGSEDHVLDTDSIPSTTSLIGIFEQNVAPKKDEKPAVRRPAISASVIQPPSKDRSSTARLRSPEPFITKSSKTPEIKSPKPSSTQPILPKPKELEAAKPFRRAREPSPPTSKPIPIPSKAQPREPRTEDGDASSNDSFVSASDYKPSWRAALQNQNRRLTSNSTHSINTVDSLANAIVASSIASSRAASPSRSQQSILHPPPPPPRRSPHKHLFHSSKEISRTPSPAKQQGVLRATLRKPKGDEDVDEGEVRRKKKAHLMKKHPNKHHEGDRKRWRDEITERERKRYEAVWASNRGLYTDPGLESNVCSLVEAEWSIGKG
ncbi:Increased rDNA silencing 4 [Hyphodiscus hymeniophilus]|uniref:Increased rDNA silencing 4 n=1 Tax=Hyphodiscus hymeniophilus TaxID=353542 RepID=A0A9P7AWR3_9HELO|nr:Increased rDNA silencing 4 [Hyphodiscus hymeniophilus]